MPSFDTTRRVRHTAAQMFDLVSDVEAYPQFLPLCTALRVLTRTREGEQEVFVAEMQVGFKAIRETFKTRVACDRPTQHILVEYIDGPFRYLKNSWAFRGHCGWPRRPRRLPHRIRVSRTACSAC